jgi:hypothetical protein
MKPHPPSQSKAALKKAESSNSTMTTVFAQPEMGFEELWDMVEKNIGQPLAQTSLGCKPPLLANER